MDCPQCGFHNTPGSGTCFRCRGPLIEGAAETFFPPRAKTGGRRPRAGNLLLRVSGWAGELLDDYPGLYALASVIPGLGHLAIRQAAKAAAFLLMYLVFAGFTIYLWPSLAAGFFFWIMVSVHATAFSDVLFTVRPKNMAITVLIITAVSCAYVFMLPALNLSLEPVFFTF